MPEHVDKAPSLHPGDGLARRIQRLDDAPPRGVMPAGGAPAPVWGLGGVQQLTSKVIALNTPIPLSWTGLGARGPVEPRWKAPRDEGVMSLMRPVLVGGVLLMLVVLPVASLDEWS